jgi:hypothetical protein
MPLKVIGAGLGRTGTLSLKTALEQLGFGPCHHMFELAAHPETWDFWRRAYGGLARDWEEGFKGYLSAVDDPAASFWLELSQAYPDAKIILTVRDREQWFRSGQDTALSETMRSVIENAPPHMQPLFELFEPMGWDPRAPRTHDRQAMLAWFEEHNQKVRRTIAPERLLVFDVSQGWAPLCRFLDVEVPAGSFPRVNTTEDFIKTITGPPPVDK